jgi:beta-glucosidase
MFRADDCLRRTVDWEGFGSDPVLQAFGGALSIEGIQSTGVIATIKHLIANEQEQYRMYSLVKPGISSNVDDRTLHELYLWPFAEGKLISFANYLFSLANYD